MRTYGHIWELYEDGDGKERMESILVIIEVFTSCSARPHTLISGARTMRFYHLKSPETSSMARSENHSHSSPKTYFVFLH